MSLLAYESIIYDQLYLNNVITDDQGFYECLLFFYKKFLVRYNLNILHLKKVENNFWLVFIFKSKTSYEFRCYLSKISFFSMPSLNIKILSKFLAYFFPKKCVTDPTNTNFKIITHKNLYY